MNLVMRSIVHSVLQITMLNIPLMVLLSWLLKQSLTLDFNFFEATIFFLMLIAMSNHPDNSLPSLNRKPENPGWEV